MKFQGKRPPENSYSWPPTRSRGCDFITHDGSPYSCLLKIIQSAHTKPNLKVCSRVGRSEQTCAIHTKISCKLMKPSKNPELIAVSRSTNPNEFLSWGLSQPSQHCFLPYHLRTRAQVYFENREKKHPKIRKHVKIRSHIGLSNTRDLHRYGQYANEIAPNL